MIINLSLFVFAIIRVSAWNSNVLYVSEKGGKKIRFIGVRTGSEPQPNLSAPNPRFSSRFGKIVEPNLAWGSGFRNFWKKPNGTEPRQRYAGGGRRKTRAGLWAMKYPMWPSLSWGLVLGCNLVKFKHSNGKIIPAMGRLFAILVSTAWHTIWNIRNDKVLKNPHQNITDIEIHNRWLKSVNSALGRDRILTNKMKFGNLALKKDLVLRTWSGLLMNEDALPDDWTYTVGVLVGIQPLTLNDPRNGIG